MQDSTPGPGVGKRESFEQSPADFRGLHNKIKIAQVYTGFTLYQPVMGGRVAKH